MPQKRERPKRVRAMSREGQKALLVWFETDMHAQLRKEHERTGIVMTELVRRAVARYLGQKGGKPR